MITELQKLGLSPEESNVYLATLEIGGGSVSNIAHKANIHRVSCYHTIEKLVNKQLLSQHTKNKAKYFSAENPNILQQQALQKVNIAKNLIPELLSLQNTVGFKPKIHFFEGKEGVERVFNESLKSTTEILQFSNLTHIFDRFPRLFKKTTKLKLEKNIKTRILAPYQNDINQLTKSYLPKNFPPHLFEILFINPAEFQFEAEIFIFKDSIGIISIEKDETMGLIIENPSLSRSLKAIFDLAWIGASNFVMR